MNKRLIIIFALLLATIGLSAQIDKALEAKITAFTKEKYPDDKKKRKEVYKQQIEAYNALQTVDDYEALNIAREKYTDDYYMQMHVYNQQVVGKEFLTLADDMDAKQLAVSQYPGDYHMQKYVYQRNLEARGIDPTPKPKKAPLVNEAQAQELAKLEQEVAKAAAQPKAEVAPAVKKPVQSTPAVVKTVAQQPTQTVAQQPVQTVLAPATPRQTSFVPTAVTNKIKSLVEEYFPDDKALQQEVYDAQVDAFQFLFDASDKDLRNALFKKYPYDFVAQKNEYLSAKGNEVATPAP